MQVEVDIAGETNDDSGNNLTKRTEIQISAKATFGGNERQFGVDYMDANTENWSAPDYSDVVLECGTNLPDTVTEYEDLQMHWTFKVQNSSGEWVLAYQDGSSGYSQTTSHIDSEGCGFYLIYDDYECDSSHFTKAHIDDAVGWATHISNPSEHDIAHSVKEKVNGNVTGGCICSNDTSWLETCWTGARGDHSNGMCCCRAHGMMLALQVLGVGLYTHVYVNERPEPGVKGFNPSTPILCPGCNQYCVRGSWWGDFWNSWEGACRSGGTGSTCYAPAGKFEGSYNEIRAAFGPYYWTWGGSDFNNKCPGGPGHLSPP